MINIKCIFHIIFKIAQKNKKTSELSKRWSQCLWNLAL